VIIISKLKRLGLVGGTLVVIFELGIESVLCLITNFLLERCFGSADYGIITTVLTTLSLCVTFMMLGFKTVIAPFIPQEDTATNRWTGQPATRLLPDSCEDRSRRIRAAVLEGMSDTLPDNRCRLICCEVHETATHRLSAESYGGLHTDIQSILQNHGFKTELIKRTGMEIHIKATE
jgi:hypothetical protein